MADEYDVFVWLCYGGVTVYSLKTIEDIHQLYKEIEEVSRDFNLMDQDEKELLFDPDIFIPLFAAGDRNLILKKLDQHIECLIWHETDIMDRESSCCYIYGA